MLSFFPMLVSILVSPQSQKRESSRRRVLDTPFSVPLFLLHRSSFRSSRFFRSHNTYYSVKEAMAGPRKSVRTFPRAARSA